MSAGVDLDNVDADALLLDQARTADVRGAVSVPAGADTLPAAPDEFAGWADDVAQWSDVVREMLPAKCAAKLTPERVTRIGAAWVKVCRHYDWKRSALFSHPVAGLLWECAPVAQPAVMPWVMGLFEQQAPANDTLTDSTGTGQDTPAG